MNNEGEAKFNFPNNKREKMSKTITTTSLTPSEVDMILAEISASTELRKKKNEQKEVMDINKECYCPCNDTRIELTEEDETLQILGRENRQLDLNDLLGPSLDPLQLLGPGSTQNSIQATDETNTPGIGLSLGPLSNTIALPTDDPFANGNDPFANGNDPFADGNDPFANENNIADSSTITTTPSPDTPTTTEDAFLANDPFANDPFANDPFADDPFADDPFASKETDDKNKEPETEQEKMIKKSFEKYYKRVKSIYKIDVRLLEQLSEILQEVKAEEIPKFVESFTPVLMNIPETTLEVSDIIGMLATGLKRSTFEASLTTKLGNLDFINIGK